MQNAAGRSSRVSGGNLGHLRVRWCGVAFWASALLIGAPAWAADFPVGNESQLRSAITGANAGDTITFTSSITLTADLPAVQKSVTIIGAGNTLSGNN